MNDPQIETLVPVRRFLEGTEAVCFEIEIKATRYRWTQTTRVKFRRRALGQADKGLLTRDIRNRAGYSLAQVQRLVKPYRGRRRLARKQRALRGFSRKYPRNDQATPAALDERPGTLSGPATQKLGERADPVFGETGYPPRLAGISIAHVYNLRKSRTDTDRRRQFEKIKPAGSTIGARRKPNPNGRPGFIRIDSVH